MPETRSGRGAGPDTPPPILGSWRALYIVLTVELVVLVALFAGLTWWAK